MRNTSIFSYVRNDISSFVNLISDKNYIFRATLINPKSLTINLQKSAILELDIEDNVYNPFFKGHVVIDNRDNVIERFKTDSTLSEFSNKSLLRGYRTRGDARDILLLSILPVDKGVTEGEYNMMSDSYYEVFGLQLMFVISDEIDTSNENSVVKRYTIQDFDYQILSERNTFFSTTSLLEGKSDIANLTDSEREATTGKIIKAILQTVLQDKSVIKTEVINGVAVTPDFEDGASKLFYSSPANYTAIDDISYMYSLHVSDNAYKDFAFLNKNQYTGEYELISASNIFKNSFNKTNDSGGKYYLENFTLQGGTKDVSGVIQNSMKKPAVALEFGELSDIIDIKFFNPPGKLYQDTIKTNLVHSYNCKTKMFHINGVDGDIENIKKSFDNIFVAPMKGKNAPSPNFILNNTQKTNLNYNNVFTIYNNDNDFIKLAVGRNTVLKNALKLNLGIEMTVQGGLHRHAGKFISIDRSGSYVENDFDDKFLGIYFIISVNHIFVNDNNYYNKIVAIKTYSFTDLKNNEDIV